MAIQSAKVFSKGFSEPDERRSFIGHGHLDVIKFEDGTTVGRATFEPGWRWSNDVKPIAETESCEVMHSGYCMKGQLRVRMNSGEEFEVRAGDAFHIPPGHDAWVEGNEPCEMLDVSGFSEYALRRDTLPKAA